MKKLVIANWKLNPSSLQQALVLAKACDKKGVVICPPFPFLIPVKNVLEKAELGAQDLFWEDKGAYTGEVSPLMLKKIGVKYVILGHSERRALGETDEMINKKVLAALKAGLKVILCVGENLAVRRRGLVAVKKFVKHQLEKDLKKLSTFNFQLSTFIVAYEPVWAISRGLGTGKSCDPEQAVEMHKFIKETLYPKPYTLNPTIIYGGSVDGKNAAGFLKHSEIDGVLVGGASLHAKEFLKIYKIISE